jgi:protease I
MGKKIAVLITDEFEDSEFTSPAEAFRKAGHEVITIEKEAGKTVKGHKGEASVTIDETIDNVSPQILTPCFYPAAIHRIPCAETSAS